MSDIHRRDDKFEIGRVDEIDCRPHRQIYVDECSTDPCQNEGRCVSTENDFTCDCKDGFEGDVPGYIRDEYLPRFHSTYPYINISL